MEVINQKKNLNFGENNRPEISLNNNLKRWFLEKNRKTKEQLAVKYLDFEIIDSDRKPISIVCFDINRSGDKYTRLVVAVDSEEFDKYLDTVY